MTDRESHNDRVVDRQAIANAFRDILLRHHPPQGTAAAIPNAAQIGLNAHDTESTDRDLLVPLHHVAPATGDRQRLAVKESAETPLDSSTTSEHPHVNFANLSPAAQSSKSGSPKDSRGSPNGHSSGPEALPTISISIGVPPKPVSNANAKRATKDSEYNEQHRSECVRAAKDIALSVLAALVILSVIVSSIIVSIKLGNAEPRVSAQSGGLRLVINQCITVTGSLIHEANSSSKNSSATVLFERVPYALPARRWHLAQAIDSDSVCYRRATEAPIQQCLHFDSSRNEYSGSDDCLIATVQSTQRAMNKSSNLLPLLLVFSSEFYCKPSELRTPPSLVSQLDAVLFVAATRVGLTGYMTWDASRFDFEHAQGIEPLHSNVALSDAIAALRFVKAYASRFGASANDVVLAARGASASDLLVLLSAKLKSQPSWTASQFYKALWLSSPSMHFVNMREADDNAARRTASVLARSACGSRASDRIGCLRNLTHAELAQLTRQLLQYEPELFSAFRCAESAELPVVGNKVNVASALPYAGNADWFVVSPFETWLNGSAAINYNLQDNIAWRMQNTSNMSNSAIATNSRVFSTKVPILFTTSLNHSSSQSVSTAALPVYIYNLTTSLYAQAGRKGDGTLAMLERNLLQSVSSTSLLHASLTRVCPLAAFAEFALISRRAADSCDLSNEDYLRDVEDVRSAYAPFDLLLFDSAALNLSESDWSLVFEPLPNSQARKVALAFQKSLQHALLRYDPLNVRVAVGSAMNAALRDDYEYVKTLINSTSSFYCSASRLQLDDALSRVARTCYALLYLTSEIYTVSPKQKNDVLRCISQFATVA